jgi:hypothetical protein
MAAALIGAGFSLAVALALTDDSFVRSAGAEALAGQFPPTRPALPGTLIPPGRPGGAAPPAPTNLLDAAAPPAPGVPAVQFPPTRPAQVGPATAREPGGPFPPTRPALLDHPGSAGEAVVPVIPESSPFALLGLGLALTGAVAAWCRRRGAA